MAAPFQKVMRDLNTELCAVYEAKASVIIPGSGTYGMEACARQFAQDKKVIVIRNGFFSFRWSDIFDCCGIPAESQVIMAGTKDVDTKTPLFSPPAIEDVVAAIRRERPAAVFAPHVETSTGILLPDSYVRAVADAIHEVDGVFVLDGIASGTIFPKMETLGVDAYITAPQKGWSGPCCCGIVMLSDHGIAVTKAVKSKSFCCNLNQWLTVMETYVNGGFKYYTTLPTDALTKFRDVMMETKEFGYDNATAAAWSLGTQVRATLAARGYSSVAAPDFASPGVVVSYAPSADMVARFKAQGIQVAGGVPFKINEPAGLITFRIGLFGLDKLKNIPLTLRLLEEALDGMPKQ
jgi:aspartate aminotransferase-like enzyme